MGPGCVWLSLKARRFASRKDGVSISFRKSEEADTTLHWCVDRLVLVLFCVSVDAVFAEQASSTLRPKQWPTRYARQTFVSGMVRRGSLFGSRDKALGSATQGSQTRSGD